MLKFIKNGQKLRSAFLRRKLYSKPCFCGFREKTVWGETNHCEELRAYENWLKEL